MVVPLPRTGGNLLRQRAQARAVAAFLALRLEGEPAVASRHRTCGARFATNSPDMPHESPLSWEPASGYTLELASPSSGLHGAVCTGWRTDLGMSGRPVSQ